MRWVIALVLAGLCIVAVAAGERWLQISSDGCTIRRAAVGLLQEPGEALGALAPDTAGNLVR